jgi:hypothetical protein
VFRDPLGLLTFELPLGWLEEPDGSRLSRLAFIPWTDDAWVTVEVFPTLTNPPSDDSDAWRTAAAAAISAPPDAEKVPLDSREGPAVFLRRPEPSGEEFAALVVRGSRADVVARAHGSGHHKAVREVLEELCATVDVPMNRLREPTSEIDLPTDVLQPARDALDAHDLDTARTAARKVLERAGRIYVEGTLRSSSEIARATAALVAVDAMTILAQALSSASLARDAESLARRMINSAGAGGASAPVLEGMEARLTATRGVQLLLMGKSPSEASLRSAQIAGARVWRTIEELQLGPPDNHARVEMLEAAVVDALLEVIDAKKAPAASHLVRSLLTGSTVSTMLSQMAMRAARTERAIGADELAVELARTGLERSDPKAISLAQLTLAQALLNLSGTLTEFGDPPTLARADEAVGEAEELLDSTGDEGAARAWACLQRASLLLWQRQTDGVLEIVDRGLTAAASDPAAAAHHRSLLLQLRATALAAGRNSIEAQTAMREALQEPLAPDTAGLLRAGLELVRFAEFQLTEGDRHAAVKAAVEGLERVLSVAPFGTEAVRAFRVAANALRVPTPTLEEFALLIAADQAAVAALDVRRVQLGSDVWRIVAEEARLAGEARQDWVQDLLDHGLVEEAIPVADAGRARALMELLPRANSLLESGMGTPQQEPWVPQPQISPQERLRVAADWEARAANQILAAAGESLPIDLTSIRLLASESQSTIIMLQPVGDRLALLVLLPDGEAHLRWSTLSSDQAAAAAGDLASLLKINAVGRGSDGAAPEPADLDVGLAPLSSALVEPVADLLLADGAVVLVPYRESWLVPFGLLTLPDGRRVGDVHAVSLVPSLSTLQALRARGTWIRPRPRHAYLAGDPLLPPRFLAMGLSPLAGAAAEVGDVAEQLRAHGVAKEDLVQRTGAAAGELSYRTEAIDCDLVHLACHARLREPASASCLYLAPAGHFDGLLTAAEVPSVRLADALVVLTACDSGQGRPTADGLIGLGRGFLEAGARVVVVSLWKVSDAATAALASHLYAALLDPSLTRDLAHALQDAVRQTRDQLAAGSIVDANGVTIDARPAHWAPFVAVGDAWSVKYVDEEDADGR